MNKRLEMLIQMTGSGKADAFAWYALAMEHRKDDNPTEALATFVRLKEAFPDYLPQYLMAGQTALELEQPAVAVPWLEQGITLATATGDSKTLSELSAALDEAKQGL